MEEDKGGSKQGGSGKERTDGPSIKLRQRQRAVAKGKFISKVRILNDILFQKSPPEVLDDVYSEICDMFKKTENISDKILQEADDDSQSEHLEYVGDLQKAKRGIHCKLLKVRTDQKQQQGNKN